MKPLKTLEVPLHGSWKLPGLVIVLLIVSGREYALAPYENI